MYAASVKKSYTIEANATNETTEEEQKNNIKQVQPV